MKQFVVSPSMGKRLIAKTLVSHSAVSNALKTGTVVIIAGTTNGYVAEESYLSNIVNQPYISKNQGFRGGMHFLDEMNILTSAYQHIKPKFQAMRLDSS